MPTGRLPARTQWIRHFGSEQVSLKGCEPARMGEGFGDTMTAERASPALRFRDGGWNDPGGQERMKLADGLLRPGAKVRSESDGPPRLALRVVDGPLGHGTTEHLLQAEGLGAELDIVVIPSPLATVLVLDRQRNLDQGLSGLATSRWAMELDEVGAAIEPEPPRGDPEPALGADAPATLHPRAIGPLMQHVAAACVHVVDVEHVEVPQGRATIAIEEGVQCRRGESGRPPQDPRHWPWNNASTT